MMCDTFADVIKMVARHVDASGHQDIRVLDDVRGLSTGYYCYNCPFGTPAAWMAHVDTIYRLPEALMRQAMDTKRRTKLGREIVRKALEPQPIRLTSWERILRA
jgi:hypothetical protein